MAKARQANKGQGEALAYDPFGPAAFDWWEELQGVVPSAKEGEDPPRNRPNRRGDRATLARCHGLSAIALTPAFHRLRRRVVPRVSRWSHRDDESLALLAGVLAHVRSNSRDSLVERLAKGESGKARMSGLRFRRLLAVKTTDEALSLLIGAVRLAERTANVRQLARDIRWLLHPDEKTKKDWALDYYSNAPDED